MSISPKTKSMIVAEFNYVVEKMNNTEDYTKKIYYFSGTYGILQRVFNIEYDSELVFMHQILQHTYEKINAKMTANIQQIDRLIMPNVIFEKLPELISAMAEEFEASNTEGVRNKLKQISLLAFITTGNGFYLYDKEIIKI